jgi:aminotransferase in exopolysaccharide biosynthesis
VDKFKEIIEFIRDLYKTPTGFIPLHAPVFNGNEKKYLNECIDTTFVSSVGKFVDLFEEKIAEYTGATKAVSCVNGTNALHLALQLVGVERDTEVITQPLTFVATANAISYCGAHPVFLDVDMDTMGLSPQALKNWLEQNVKIDPRTNHSINQSTNRIVSACVPMHTFGRPCRIDEIVEICNEYNIPVVEDAAESLGSYYKNKHTGTFGKIGVLSFNGNKVITTGGGGMLLFKDEELAKRAKHLTTQAKVPHPWEFNHDAIGYNYRMPNINAALGLAQLEQLPKFLESKRQIAESYKNFFSNNQSPDSNHSTLPAGRQVNQSANLLVKQPILFVDEPINAVSNFWLNCILLSNREERDAFLKFSNENAVMTRPAWTLMNELPMFTDCQADDLKNAYDIADRLVNLPSSVIHKCCIK